LYLLPQQEQPAAGVVTFFKEGQKIWETQPAAAEGKSLKLKVPLDRLPEGEYTCQVTVLNPADRKVAFWQAPVMVIH
jgi:hypothetical protein